MKAILNLPEEFPHSQLALIALGELDRCLRPTLAALYGRVVWQVGAYSPGHPDVLEVKLCLQRRVALHDVLGNSLDMNELIPYDNSCRCIISFSRNIPRFRRHHMSERPRSMAEVARQLCAGLIPTVQKDLQTRCAAAT